MTTIAILSGAASVFALVLSMILVFRTPSVRSVARTQKAVLDSAAEAEIEASRLLASLHAIRAKSPLHTEMPVSTDWVRDADFRLVLKSIEAVQIARSLELVEHPIRPFAHSLWTLEGIDFQDARGKSSWPKATPRTSTKTPVRWDLSENTGALAISA